jgi:hypothetical protein
MNARTLYLKFTLVCAITLLIPAAGFCGQSAAVPTFTKDIAPIVQKNCQVCHRPGEAGPFSMLTYEQTRPWAAAMKEAV